MSVLREQKDERQKKMLVGGFIIAVMVFSAFGFIMGYRTEDEQLSYGQLKFARTQAGFATEISGKNIHFQYFPTQVEYINITGSLGELAAKKMVYITYDPASAWASEMAQVQFNMEQILPAFSGIYVARGLINSTGQALPEISCANATAAIPVMEFRESNDTTIKAGDGCVVASAKSSYSVFMLQDRILYAILGVIK